MELDILEAAKILITLPSDKKYVNIIINNYNENYCDKCKTTFSKKSHLLRHIKNKHNEYVVEKIIDIKLNDRRKKIMIENCLFLIKWEGYSKKHNSWEPYDNVKHLDNIFTIFYNNFK